MNLKFKKPIYFIIFLTIVFILAGCTLVRILNTKINKPDDLFNLNISQPAVDVSTLRRKIDGKIMESQDEINFYPIAIMVENNLEAWPLSGLDKANLVIEAITESSIPRFLAFYANDDEIEKIGPVRSIRPYYLDWAEPYQPLFMHVGGSPEALQLIKKYNFINLDQFFNDQYYWRDNWRYAPHNVYTSSEKINKALIDKEVAQPFDYKSWKYKDDLVLEKRPEQTNDIVINYTKDYYQAKWVYNREENNYQRYQNGEIEKMNDGAKIYAKNVIIEVHKTIVLDDIGRKKITTIGEGNAWVFRDGEMIGGKWKKEDPTSMTRYYDLNDAEVELNGGTAWIEIVPNEDIIRY
ncbi:DUF3048 domain-containing protein [Candidatus Falkowbacteria bacterium]|nr:DUF3048 domain-containing protein [Candidatus Falkowbacteria bacterium]